jgi:hypothetical protein
MSGGASVDIVATGRRRPTAMRSANGIPAGELQCGTFRPARPTLPKASTAEEALALYERARRQRANAVQIESREQARALQGSDLEKLNPGRNAEDRGLFDYNPATVPI